MSDSRHPGLGLAGRLEALDVLDDCAEQGICLESGKTGQTIRATDKDRRVVYIAQVADEGLLKGHL